MSNGPRVLVSYETTADGGPVTKADLWFSTDQGRTWQLARQPGSGTCPLTFEPPADGEYGFYLVLSNAAGASSEPPSAGTQPQRTVRVDRTAPNVAVLSVRPNARFELNREVEIRWRVEDAGLPNRPVALHFRSSQTKAFELIAERQAAISAYRWTVPSGVTGRVEVCVSAADRAGNVGRCTVDAFRIERGRAVAVAAASQRVESREQSDKTGDAADVTAVISLAGDGPDGPADPISNQSAEAARRRYDLGTWHRLRNETGEAMTRLLEAIHLDPTLIAARVDLAGLYILQDRLDEAEKQLREALSREPAHRAAIKSLALVQARRRNYQTAGEMLQKYLLLEPKDPEAWVAFGDVCLFRADRAAAREAWEHAAALAEATADLKRRVEGRLALQRGEGLAMDLSQEEATAPR